MSDNHASNKKTPAHDARPTVQRPCADGAQKLPIGLPAGTIKAMHLVGSVNGVRAHRTITVQAIGNAGAKVIEFDPDSETRSENETAIGQANATVIAIVERYTQDNWVVAKSLKY